MQPFSVPAPGLRLATVARGAGGLTVVPTICLSGLVSTRHSLDCAGLGERPGFSRPVGRGGGAGQWCQAAGGEPAQGCASSNAEYVWLCAGGCPCPFSPKRCMGDASFLGPFFPCWSGSLPACPVGGFSAVSRFFRLGELSPELRADVLVPFLVLCDLCVTSDALIPWPTMCIPQYLWSS